MFSHKLITWYLIHKRNLPWRTTTNPYYIWLSEIILQQTRVTQGLPYYERFVEFYPAIEDLANAAEEEVLRLWQGLGYYSRGRNLHFTAQYIVNELGGVFPRTFYDLRKLKGVGDYTAAAIASFAFKESVPAIDGNALRVFTRWYGIEKPIDDKKTQKEVFEIASSLMEGAQPDLFNQAVMELGATVCVPQKPACDTCPVYEGCSSGKSGKHRVIPFKAKKTKVRDRDITYLVVGEVDRVFMKKRGDTDIWANMFDFPEVSKEMLGEMASSYSLEVLPPVKHVLSHQRLTIQFVILPSVPPNIEGDWYTLEQAGQLPKPKVIVDFLKSYPF